MCRGREGRSRGDERAIATTSRTLDGTELCLSVRDLHSDQVRVGRKWDIYLASIAAGCSIMGPPFLDAQ